MTLKSNRNADSNDIIIDLDKVAIFRPNVEGGVTYFFTDGTRIDAADPTWEALLERIVGLANL